MQLSPHFTLDEAQKSQVALRNGIDNTPPDWAIPRLKEVAVQILEPCRVHYGMPYSPSSWWRSDALCRALVSRRDGEADAAFEARQDRAAGSQHAKGEAVDFEVFGVSNLELARWISQTLIFDQLILEFHNPAQPNSGWVHCSYAGIGSGRDNRHEILWYNGGVWHTGLPNL